MSVDATLPAPGQPETSPRLPIAVALLWLAAITASALPWLDQLLPSQLVSAFWSFDGDQYAAVLAHFLSLIHI